MDEAHTSTSPFYTVHANLPIRKAGALRKEGRTGSSRLFTLQRCNCGTVTLCQRYGGDVSRKRKKKKETQNPKRAILPLQRTGSERKLDRAERLVSAAYNLACIIPTRNSLISRVRAHGEN